MFPEGAPQLPFDFSPDFRAAPALPEGSALRRFHPVIQRWFAETLGAPSPAQVEGWPAIHRGQDVLIAAPTGSGKTLAAFLAALDRLFRLALDGRLTDETRVVYVSPLRALSHDVQKNLLGPLEEIRARASAAGLSPQAIRVLVRTGDTKASERAAMVRKPPHVLITTPESLYLYLTSPRSAGTLAAVETVIVDEIHALARDKRGAHLAISLERLGTRARTRPQRVGLSATVKPLERMAAFLTGREDGCRLVQAGHVRPWELSVEIPDSELSAAATHEMWGQIYDRLVALSETHRTTLVFANTRRLAERVAHDLSERLGDGVVAAHHGSMARELRQSAEERLKAGTLKVMVATASLELGIDIGDVDLVCQLGSPRSVSVLLQRIGRAGHRLGGVSKGILFATTRDELVECTALARAVREGILDATWMPERPLDVLAQQIVACCAIEPCDERRLYALMRAAHPMRELPLESFEQVLTMLADGVSTSRGRRGVLLHRDRVNHVLRPRKGARILALTNGGTIPDNFSYPVICEPENEQVGTLDEDFAVESMAGDVFVLGSTSWRIRSVRGGAVQVENAHGQAPTVPFWRGEAPSRTDELSHEVGRLRETVASRPDAIEWAQGLGLTEAAARQLSDYLRASEQVLGALPSTSCVIAERFFDEAGGMQLILHAPFGGRINRAWGLALRKRFCRTFDFELQAAASDDGVLLSLGEQHSFPLEDVFQFLSESNVEDVLTQAVLQAPLFGTRFRHNATRALMLSRTTGGKRVPPHLQRMRADDLLAAVFPAQVGCQDNHGGTPLEVPDHPLVKETVDNCLREAMDVDGLKAVLRGIRDGRIRTVARDLPEPSPLAHQMLSSQPYTFLDEAPLEERRARAVSVRRTLSPEDAASFGALDEAAIRRVVEEAQPPVRDAEELHDLLLQVTVLPVGESCPPLGVNGGSVLEQHRPHLTQLIADNRAAEVAAGKLLCWAAAERVPHVRALFPDARWSPPLEPLPGEPDATREEAVLSAVRGHMELCGPTTAHELAGHLGLGESEITAALFQLESRGQVLRGTFRPSAPPSNSEVARVEWCDRSLLQRIHRLTVNRLRQEIEPLSSQDFMRFLFRWHHLEPSDRLRGRNGLLKAITLLEGWEAPVAAWELALFPARMGKLQPELLEQACWSGEVAFARLSARERAEPSPRRGVVVPKKPAAPSRSAQLTFTRRASLDWMLQVARGAESIETDASLSHPAADVLEVLRRRGASFFQELVTASRRLPSEVEDALWELLARGHVTADALENLRVLQSPKWRKRRRALGRGGPGRWSLLAPLEPLSPDALLEKRAELFLRRWGIVCRELAMREPLAPSWRDLARVYRRMEARGEIRGGRFLSGLAGEQFALPEAVEMARAVRRKPSEGLRIHLAAVDPLNLTGIVTPGPRIPAVLGHFVTYVDGVPRAPEDEASAIPEEIAAAPARAGPSGAGPLLEQSRRARRL